MTIDRRTRKITRNDEYYVLAHASRFVRAGAFRVGSNEGADDVDHVAFVNPDGQRVLYVVNGSDRARTIEVAAGDRRFRYTLAPKSLHTFAWSP